jgi:hypothetical protein
MIKTLRFAASAFALTVALSGAATAQTPAQTRVFTAKDMASLERLTDPACRRTAPGCCTTFAR